MTIRHERRDDGVAVITLDRPASRNALSLAMLHALHAALLDAQDARCVVLAAEGPAFCAGHDLHEITAARGAADAGRAFLAETLDACAAVMRAILRHPVPVIAAVQGIATAAGCQLVASCDLAVAAPGARFATPGMAIGLFCTTPAVALTRAMARKQAAHMLFSAQPIGAQEALRIGLISQIADDARAGALAQAACIAAASAVAVRAGKAGLIAQAEAPLDLAYEAAGRIMLENLLAADAIEGIGAFIDKRPPHWKDA